MNVKNLIQKVIVCILALMPFLTLCFNLLAINSYDNKGLITSTGYSLLSCSSPFPIQDDGWTARILGILSIISLIIGAISVLIAVRTFNDSENIRADILIMLIAVFIAGLYLIEGIAFKIVYEIGGPYDKEILARYDLHTSGYVPLILVALLIGAYIFVVKFLPDEIRSFSSNKQLSATDELKAYKELLDAGIITQEEFDMKKKQILNL